MTAHKRPKLTLVGTLGVLAGVSLIASCSDDSKVDVERARYTTLSDCEQDWARPEDCVSADGNTQPASGTGYSGGGSGHGGSGRWYGPYYTRTGTVYHNDGEKTNERVSVRNAAEVTESNISPRSWTGSTESEEVSRGGFGESAHGGGEGGEGGGGHGGGGGEGGGG
jgi:uncharacterized protein YgiB involved in biofilm formation